MREAVAPVPRWGNQGRDRKAIAIWRTLVCHRGEAISTGTWLDVGCGSGGIAATLAPRVYRIVGIDPEPWPNWVSTQADVSNLVFQTAAFDGESLPVPDQAVDVVVCNQVYEHVGDPVALLRNIHRALKPGGCCYFAGPNVLWPIEPHVFWPFVHWLPRALARRVMKLLGASNAHELDAYSTHCWRLRRWFRDCGFVVENGLRARIVAALLDGGHDVLAAGVSRTPGGLFVLAEALSPGLVFILQKPTQALGGSGG
jgi:2-polyprenyl-3-methyl-5-hydroxy-6-metoxy-1,4-benzoquinol methylase